MYYNYVHQTLWVCLPSLYPDLPVVSLVNRDIKIAKKTLENFWISSCYLSEKTQAPQLIVILESQSGYLVLWAKNLLDSKSIYWRSTYLLIRTFRHWRRPSLVGGALGKDRPLLSWVCFVSNCMYSMIDLSI